MGFEDIRLAIEGRVVEWDGAPVAFDNAATQPSVQTAIDAKSPWVRLTIQSGDSITASIGSRPTARHTGLIMCQVFTDTPLPTGTASAQQIADSLAEHLSYWQEGKLDTQAASVRRIGPRDGWYQVNLSVPYRAN